MLLLHLKQQTRLVFKKNCEHYITSTSVQHLYGLLIYSTSTRPGEGAIYRYLSRQGKIAGDIHETKSSGLSLS